MALQQRNPSALTEWVPKRAACSWSYTWHSLPHCPDLAQNSITLQNSRKHSHQGWVDAMKSYGLCNTFKTNVIAGRNVWLQKISDPKRDLDRVPGLSGDLRRYCWRQVCELSVHVSRSHSGLSAASAHWNWNAFCYAVLSMRSSAQEEDNIIEHAQCCPERIYKHIHRFLDLPCEQQLTNHVFRMLMNIHRRDIINNISFKHDQYFLYTCVISTHIL